MATRKPVKALNKSTAEVAANAAADKARKAASRAALRAAKKATTEAAKQAAASVVQAPEIDEEVREAQRRADNLAAARVEADATGMTFEEACVSMGIDNSTGAALEDASTRKQRYTGPMLALATARKAYVKAKNGIQCNGDPLALLCGEYPRETVIDALIAAMGLPANPYLHLNPGQQSMNLRNKARHQIREGFLKFEEVDSCLRMVSARRLIAASK